MPVEHVSAYATSLSSKLTPLDLECAKVNSILQYFSTTKSNQTSLTEDPICLAQFKDAIPAADD